MEVQQETKKEPLWRDRLAAYESNWFEKIEGYATSDTISIVLPLLQQFQDRLEVKGDIGEIGVHHGRFFFALDALRSAGERSLAIDVFGNQSLNIDRSGLGDLEKFTGYVRDVSHDPSGISVFAGDSLGNKSREYMEKGRFFFRLFSVDGGHTVIHALNDIKLAESFLCSGGVVLVDDFCHAGFPGVTEGIFKYLSGSPRLVPVCTVASKLVFVSTTFAAELRKQISTHVNSLKGRRARKTIVAGHEVYWLIRV